MEDVTEGMVNGIVYSPKFLVVGDLVWRVDGAVTTGYRGTVKRYSFLVLKNKANTVFLYRSDKQKKICLRSTEASKLYLHC